MAVNAIVKDGQITNLGAAEETTKKKSDSSSSVDKEQFLQLLVAQMKYQDPLEPTDNTQYVSQLATFSELEQMQNVAKTSEMQRATQMVGSLVTINATSEATGAVTEVTGKVDYVTKQGSDIKVSVNDTLYNLEDVKNIWDNDYADASALAGEWANTYGQLPNVNQITAKNASQYENAVRTLYETLNDMNSYQKSFLSPSLQSGLQAYIDALKSYGIDVTASQPSANTGSGTGSAANQGTGNGGSSQTGNGGTASGTV